MSDFRCWSERNTSIELALPPKVVESLSDAHLRMTHILAVYLADLKLTYSDVVDGIGAAETPVANDTQLSFDS